MITINLLPEELRENITFSKKNRKLLKTVKAVVIICLLVVVSLVICGVFLFGSNQFFLNNISESEKTISSYQPVVDEAKVLKDKVKSVQKIKGSYKYWTKFNYILGKNTPAGVYLATLNTQSDKITITGYAKTKNDVGIFRDALEKSGDFSEVNIDSIKETGNPAAQGTNVNSFSMNMKIGRDATNKGAK